MGSSDQPNQLRVGVTFASGVMTLTGDLHCNPALATSLADDASAVTTLSVTESGHLHLVLVVTPNTPITSAGNTVGSAVENIANRFE